MSCEELTEQETALYDRQIRIWGVDAQRRLSKAHVLVIGITGTIAEFCKNIVLAGVSTLTLIDDRPVTEDVLSTNFLIPNDKSLYKGRSISEHCCRSLQNLNPMVRVAVEKGDISSFTEDFYCQFDAVVSSCSSMSKKILTNDKCRKFSKHIAFYTVNCRSTCGEIFVDLQTYVYAKKATDAIVECQLKYPSYKEAISVPWRALPGKMSKLYFAMRVLEEFEEAEGRAEGSITLADLPHLFEYRDKLCEKNSLVKMHVPDSILKRLVLGKREFPPVCAIVGGVLGQEVIKAISGKGDPLKNFFFFDALDGKGIVEDVSDI